MKLPDALKLLQGVFWTLCPGVLEGAAFSNAAARNVTQKAAFALSCLAVCASLQRAVKVVF